MKREFTDQMARRVSVQWPPKRIISLVPSQTELLYDLGLNDEVVGITKFCIHPDEWFRSKSRVGGTKKQNMQKIAELQPDLIIGNKEENDKGEIDSLSALYPVWMSDIKNLEDACDMMRKVGELTGKEEKANAISNEVNSLFSALKQETLTDCVYLIWKDPYMAAGPGTFIHDMMQRIGFKNIFTRDRYPEFSADELRSLSPASILLSSEPFPFKEKHIAEFRRICPEASIALVDGEMFSWYGSRLLKAPAYFKGLMLESLS